MEKTLIIPENSKTLIITSDDTEDIKVHLDAWKYKLLCDDVWDKIFRPRHKHGYMDKELNDLLGLDFSEKAVTPEQEAANKVMDKLEEIWREMREE